MSEKSEILKEIISNKFTKVLFIVVVAIIMIAIAYLAIQTIIRVNKGDPTKVFGIEFGSPDTITKLIHDTIYLETKPKIISKKIVEHDTLTVTNVATSKNVNTGVNNGQIGDNVYNSGDPKPIIPPYLYKTIMRNVLNAQSEHYKGRENKSVWISCNQDNASISVANDIKHYLRENGVDAEMAGNMMAIADKPILMQYNKLNDHIEIIVLVPPDWQDLHYFLSSDSK